MYLYKEYLSLRIGNPAPSYDANTSTSNPQLRRGSPLFPTTLLAIYLVPVLGTHSSSLSRSYLSNETMQPLKKSFVRILQCTILLLLVPLHDNAVKAENRGTTTAISAGQQRSVSASNHRSTTSRRSSSYYYMDNYYGQCGLIYDNFLMKNEVAYIKAKYPGQTRSSGPSSCVLTFSAYAVDDLKYKFVSSFTNSMHDCDVTLKVYAGPSTRSPLEVCWSTIRCLTCRN